MKTKHYLFIIFIVISIIIVFFIKGSDKEVSPDRISQVIQDTQKFENLTSFIKKNIDTSFYSLYRTRDAEYFFNYIENDSVKSFFSIPDSFYNEFKPMLKALDIKEVYKYNSENFYRYNLTSEFRDRIQVLILPKEEISFSYKIGSKLNNVDTTTIEKELFNGDSKILLVNNKVRIYRYRMN